MIRVTFCAYDAPNMVGGPISWLLRILPALCERGIEVRCLFLTWGGAGDAVKQLGQVGINCSVRVCNGTTQDRVRWILEQLNADRPDVFVPNLVVPAYYAARWVREAGLPTVGVLHSDDDFYQAIQSEFVFGRSELAVTSMVCVSRELERQVFSNGPKFTDVRRIPYGVPIPEKSIRRSESRLRLVYVGRLAEQQKRISEVSHALCRVVREIPGTEAVIYGDGPDKSNVEYILESEGQDLPVRLGGRIPSDQIQDRLLNCDVIVLLSDYEGLPIAVLEAMACGVVPVCLQMRSGIPELVEDGVTGLVVQDRNDGFIEAIRSLRENPLFLSKISASARKKVTAENSIDACAHQWSKLLHQLHNEIDATKVIRVPKRFHLPVINTAFSSQDSRSKHIHLAFRIYRRGKIFAGRIKRSLLGQSIR